MLRGHCAIITVAARALEHTEEKKSNEKNTTSSAKRRRHPAQTNCPKTLLNFFFVPPGGKPFFSSFENTNTNIFVSNYNFDKILFVDNGTGMRAVRGHRSRRVFSFR